MYVVTGASRGLGLELVKSFCESKHEVIGISRGPTEFHNPNYSHFSADVSCEEQIQALFLEIRKNGNINCLVNNAGVEASIPALFTSCATFNDILSVNLLGSFVVSREALKIMKSHKFGRIINISSINSKLSSAGGVAYNASKAGLESVARTLAAEIHSNEDITINNIGVSLLEGSGMVEGLTDKARKQKTKYLTRGPFISSTEVRHAIDFFASREASNISGQTLYFGGLY